MGFLKKLVSGAKNLGAGLVNGLIGSNLGSPSSPLTKIGSLASGLVGSAIPGGGMVKTLVTGAKALTTLIPSKAEVARYFPAATGSVAAKATAGSVAQSMALDQPKVNTMSTPSTPKASAGAAAFGATGSGTAGTNSAPKSGSGNWWNDNKKWALPVAIVIGAIVTLFTIVKLFFSKRKR